MVSYEHKVKNIYLGSPYNEGQPLIPGDYTLLRGPCDEGFHVPLIEERQSIVNTGLTFTQFKVNLHIPIAGLRSGTGGNWGYDQGQETEQTSLCSVSTTGSFVDYLFYSSNSSSSNFSIKTDGKRYLGRSVRGFRNNPIIPDETRTVTITNKVWYNSDLGLITVRTGTNQYVTIQDKNVGATEVYNGTLNSNNRGKYFQRGNNYGFIRGSTGDTSTTLVDASGYGPFNPYSSSTFIANNTIEPKDRSSVQNDNLRGYTDFNS